MDELSVKASSLGDNLSAPDGSDLPEPRRDFHDEQYLSQCSLKSRDLLLLTCPNLGLQVCWFLLMSSGTPYLESLDISKSITSLVWLTGPIFGAFAQPIFGILSDESRHPWGKRKPFILCGASCVATCFLALACAEDITDGPTNAPTADSDSTKHWYTQVFAIACVGVITFAMQAYQSGVRALIVDNCPPQQQAAASAWSMRWNVAGNLVLSTVGFLDAKRTFFRPEGNAKFKILAVVTTACIVVTVGLVSYYVADSSQNPRGKSRQPLTKLCWSMLCPAELSKHWNQLPPVSHRVCTIQLFAWVAWFPVLYYTSTFAYETVLPYNFARELHEKGQLDIRLIEHAELHRSSSMLYFAFATFATSLLLHMIEHAMPAFDHTQPRIWFFSQCSLGFCLLLTFFARTGATATIIISVMGASWAVAMWIPFALISAEISQPSPSKLGGKTGWILGLHNMAMSLPQIVSAILCAVILGALRWLNIGDGIAWIFRLASIAVFYSAYLINKL
ncbi:hypothetical protein JX265_010476 [Neoarthrinium moseri]|uniref:General alpha-glucoside permease n=1 Tax=Neoarthrinium moseri TaxID=1658444 RepID=A0A9Q0ALQ6_9PEZI|nr:hypothetical protein JX265_010476 [Neoarthrinium moseri]